MKKDDRQFGASPIKRRQYMTPTEMQEKAMQVFDQGMQ